MWVISGAPFWLQKGICPEVLVSYLQIIPPISCPLLISVSAFLGLHLHPLLVFFPFPIWSSFPFSLFFFSSSHLHNSYPLGHCKARP